ncbi:hypothetical protein AN2363V1_2345 [Klebsiella oxytoca]|nr:hypothetical protein AN2363V1_2345 [Klebsiella oxytoca]CAH6074922.1 hypothetical protein AN2363V1_2345 [Klebsiella oxytoca]
MNNNIPNTVFFLKSSTIDLARKKEFPVSLCFTAKLCQSA